MSVEKKMAKEELKGKAKVIVFTLLAVIIFGAGMGTEKKINEMFNKKEITTSYISGKLEDMAELTTQQVTYSGRKSIAEGTIPYITKKGFTMNYNATMKAGIDFEDIDIKIKKKVVKVVVPHATVLSNKVDSGSIKFEDEKKAVFNWNSQEDVAEALKLAEEDVKENEYVDYSSLIDEADGHTGELIHILLDDSVGGRDVDVVFK